jgi:hypothetical protein
MNSGFDMELFLKNTIDGLVPLYDSDFEEKKRLKIDEIYKCTIKRDRSYPFHKKFFALIKIGCENSKSIDAPLNVYRKYATIKAGFFTPYKTDKGTFVEADSISFENMDEDEFQKVYSAVLDFIILDTGATKEDIEKNLISFF